MEIGSFIRLDLRDSGDYYSGEINIARLNSARAGIYHACILYNCSSVYLPYYLCPTVKTFLLEKGIDVKYYFLNNQFEPVNLNPKEDHAVLLVNYFGILPISKMKTMATRFKNVIIDNSAAFYSAPVEGCYNVYSPRKFFGLPDGCYVIGKDANIFTNGYEQDYSSITASYLFKRLEFGLEDTYNDRMKNEERITNSGILRMSELTRALLNNIDYHDIKAKRRENFYFAHELYGHINKIDPTIFLDETCVPLVYPLVIEKEDLNDRLKENRIFTGRWWNHVRTEVSDKTFEAWLSKFMVPLPIDQRYGNQELLYVHNIIMKHIK